MKKEKAQKTNACRILDKLGVSYTTLEYEVDENDLSAVHVASVTGQNVKCVFKTLVCRGDKNGVLMACIPGDGELDLKALAQVFSKKKVAQDKESVLKIIKGKGWLL